MAQKSTEYVKDETRNCGVKIQKSKREQIHIYYNKFHDKELFNLRIFYENDDGEYRPSSKGISLPEESVLELLEAIQKSMAKREKKNAKGV